MKRDEIEIIRSQQNMLIRNGNKIKEDVLPLELLEKYRNTLAKVKKWMKNQCNIEFIVVEYSALMESPLEQALRVHDFFSKQLMPEVMASIPDPKLYRERTIIN